MSPWLTKQVRPAILAVVCWLGFGVIFSSVLAADNWVTAFDQANKLYEEGRYSEAAAAYEKLTTSGPPDTALYFNLGNAYFKSSRNGLAIAAYHRARELSPRDPSVRFNLQFVRKAVTGNENTTSRWWLRALTSLTLNEWTVLTAAALWLWFGLLALREWRPSLRRALRGYTLASGGLFLLLALCAGAAMDQRMTVKRAVVIAPESVVRVGPLDEAKEMHKFRDGTEVELLDRKEITAGSTNQLWFQVQDLSGRIGWLKSGTLLRLN